MRISNNKCGCTRNAAVSFFDTALRLSLTLPNVWSWCSVSNSLFHYSCCCIEVQGLRGAQHGLGQQCPLLRKLLASLVHSWPWSLRCSVMSALCTLPPPSLFGFVTPPSPLCPHGVGESCAYPLSALTGYGSAHVTASTPDTGRRPPGPAFPRAQSSALPAHPKPARVFIYPLPTAAGRTAQPEQELPAPLAVPLQTACFSSTEKLLSF